MEAWFIMSFCIKTLSAYQKFNTVISKNTFCFFREEFRELCESYISSIAKKNIFILKNRNTWAKDE